MISLGEGLGVRAIPALRVRRDYAYGASELRSASATALKVGR